MSIEVLIVNKSKKKYLHCDVTCCILNFVVGMWHSLVARFVRDEEAAGSNPVIPTIILKF